MHGVRRGLKPTAAELQQHAERSAAHAQLIRRALSVRKQPLQWPLTDHFQSTYKVVETALETNPDEYTLWSFRRQVILLTTKNSDNIDELWRQELDLTTRALKLHPKAYPAWQHRLWLFDNREISAKISKQMYATAINQERQLSSLMLSKDGRNFHGWAHRMRLRAIIQARSPEKTTQLEEDELQFVEDKVNDDFANYSAWHHRSVLLPRINKDASFLTAELQFVRQAFYTEPDVQSTWFYHRWLLAGAPARGKQTVVVDSVLREELLACNELLSIEPEARYCLQTKAHILLQLGRHLEAYETLDILAKIVS